MTLIEAAKLAREALEEALNRPMWNRPKMENALAALDQAIAQAEQPEQPAPDHNEQHLEMVKSDGPVGEVYRYGADSHGRRWHGILWYDANLDVPTGTKLYIKEKNT